MKTLALCLFFTFLGFSTAHADVCADRAVSAVKNEFRELFKADSEGKQRVISYASCKSFEDVKLCKVGTRTLDAGENVWFSAVLDSQCTQVIGLKKDASQDI